RSAHAGEHFVECRITATDPGGARASPFAVPGSHPAVRRGRDALPGDRRDARCSGRNGHVAHIARTQTATRHAGRRSIEGGAMNCELWQDKLDAFVDLELPTAEMRDFEAHLRGCPACSAEAVARQRLKAQTRLAGQMFVPSAEFGKKMLRP